MEDEPLASEAIEVAETHPHMLRFPYPLSMLGEVSHVWGVLMFCGGMLTGAIVGFYWMPPWFILWKCVSLLTAADHHRPGIIWGWMRTAAWDRRKLHWRGTSTSDNPREWDIPLGVYDDAV